MADQNFMDLASKTASGIAGTDYMMLVNNSEAYKALVNDVAEAILSKLTSKSFSGLETTAKNVIGALNELNSKSITNQKYYNDANGESIFDIIDVGANNGLYCYRNISDIPESWGASNEYIRILKMKECMFIIRNNSYAYFTTATSGTWRKSWYKFALTLVQ